MPIIARFDFIGLCKRRVLRIAAASVTAAALLGMAVSCCKTNAPAEVPQAVSVSTYTDEQKRLDAESFEMVWTRIRDRHWDPGIGGVDWQGVYDELQPRLVAATSRNQARDLMQDMVQRLGQSHFAIIPGEAYEEDVIADEATADAATPSTAGETPGEHAPKPKRRRLGRGEGSSGVEVRVIDGEAVVTAVDPGSAGADAGVLPGWIISKVDGRELKPRLATIAEAHADSSSQSYYIAATAMAALAGGDGDSMDVEFLDADRTPVTKELTLKKADGELTAFGNLPKMYLRIDSRRVQESIQYFRFNMFFDPSRISTELAKAVKEARDQDAKGFIIDLRGNPGGIGAIAMGVGGWFIDAKNQKLGTMTTRNGTINFVIYPRLNGYRGPLAVLIDGMSASTSEIFAAGMKDLNRARLFGSRTAGAALPSTVEILPNGDRFQYAIANYVSTNGLVLEGNGVEPDESVPLDRAALLTGRDPVLDAAVKWILSEPATKLSSAGSN